MKTKLLLAVLVVVAVGAFMYFADEGLVLRSRADQAYVISSEECSDSTCDMHYVVEVSCNNLPTRRANLWVSNATEDSTSGAILFTSGDNGTSRYTYRATPAASALSELNSAGFQTFEIDWAPQRNGWFVFGGGYKDSACGYAAVSNLIHNELASAPELMCATGNSGGAFQIGYSMTTYDGEDIFDMVLYTEGPPIPEVDEYCFTERFTEEPVFAGGFKRTDFVMGWEGDENYCQLGEYTNQILRLTDKTSLVSRSENRRRDYDHPNTKVSFLLSEDGNVIDRADDYFDIITSEKDWVTVPGSIHDLPGDNTGMGEIKDILLNECN